VEESFWRRLWTCRQTEYWMNDECLNSSWGWGVHCMTKTAPFFFWNPYKTLKWIVWVEVNIFGF
jgi:hypothetical protein